MTMPKGKAGELAANTAKEYLERLIIGKIPDIADFLVDHFPGLAIDETWEKAVDYLVPFAEAAIRTKYGKSIESSLVRKYLFELGTDMIRRLSEELRRRGKGETPPTAPDSKRKKGQNEMKTIPDVWVNPTEHPGIGYHSECPAGSKHWMERGTKTEKKKGGDVEVPVEKMVVGFHKVPFESFVLAKARAPETEDELFVPDTCACSELFKRDRAIFKKQEEEKAKADQPKPPKDPFFSPEFRRGAARGVEGLLTGIGHIPTAVGHAATSAAQAVGTAAKAVGTVPDKVRKLGEELETKDAAEGQRLEDELKRRRAARAAAAKGGTT